MTDLLELRGDALRKCLEEGFETSDFNPYAHPNPEFLDFYRRLVVTTYAMDYADRGPDDPPDDPPRFQGVVTPDHSYFLRVKHTLEQGALNA